MILVEIAPGVHLSLSRDHYLYPKLQLLADEGHVSNETLTTLRSHNALSKETEMHLATWGWSVLRPILQNFAEEING
jgi:hypothetical protein